MNAGNPESLWESVEEIADQTNGVDRWCSGPDWILSAHMGFAPTVPIRVIGDRKRWVGLFSLYDEGAAAEDGQSDDVGDYVLAGPEPLWGFGCPILTPEPEAVIGEVVEALSAMGDWDRLVIPGLDRRSVLFEELAMNLQSLGEVFLADGMSRCVAEMGDGTEAWLSTRSARFRQQFRRWSQPHAGLSIEDVTVADGLMNRLMAIERNGWKGHDDGGITADSMERMYRTMIDRLGERGRLRASIAVLDGEDAAFILGGVRGSVYRGLQISYTESSRPLSLGHRLQCHQIRQLEGSGVRLYDLGMDMEYKRRWATEVVASSVLVVNRS